MKTWCFKKVNLLNTHFGGHPTKTRTVLKKIALKMYVNIILSKSVQYQFNFNQDSFLNLFSLPVLSDISHDISWMKKGSRDPVVGIFVEKGYRN